MQIIYFPYLSLGRKEELDFGEVKVWNFELKASKYIPDEPLRSHIEKIIYSNVSHKQPIKDVGVVSIGNTDFRTFFSNELDLVNEVRLIMFLSFLSKNNTIGRGANAGWLLGTSENFEFVLQNFDVGNPLISERAGEIVSMGIGGYKIGEKLFHAPSHVLKPQRFSLDGHLITQLFRLKKRGGKRLYNRILRATDLLFESYYNSPNVSRNARVLLQIAAFETLLDLPQSGQRKDFKDKMALYCNGPKEKIYKHYYETRGGKQPESISRKAIWADEYYTLRNHIIHGDDVKPVDYTFKGKQRHIDVAVLFFVLFVKKLINARYPKPVFFDEIIWKKTNDGSDIYEGFCWEDHEIARLFAKHKI